MFLISYMFFHVIYFHFGCDAAELKKKKKKTLKLHQLTLNVVTSGNFLMDLMAGIIFKIRAL